MKLKTFKLNSSTRFRYSSPKIQKKSDTEPTTTMTATTGATTGIYNAQR